MKLDYLALGAAVALLTAPSLAAPADLDERALRFRHKDLLRLTNTSICGLPMRTKGFPRYAKAGRQYKLMIKLTNNVAEDFEDVVVKMVLPEGATFKKASVFPRLPSKTPALEQQETEVVWRNVGMRAGKSRSFKILVGIECDTPTPLVFRAYTTVGGTGWITGPEVKVRSLCLAAGQSAM